VRRQGHREAVTRSAGPPEPSRDALLGVDEAIVTQQDRESGAVRRPSKSSPIRAVGAVITRADGQLLLIKRGNEPGRGLWSLPGGHVEPGESDVVAVAREVREETGLVVKVGALAGRVQRGRYDISDYFATVVSGELAAATDALDAVWDNPRARVTTPGLVEALASWGVTFDEPQ
jgi:8-oxo-dGTP diphosphatase